MIKTTKDIVIFRLNNFRYLVIAISLLLATPLVSSGDLTSQESIRKHVKSKLSEAAKVAPANINEAIAITEKLINQSSVEINDTTANYLKYRHSLYLLLADRNVESKKYIESILPFYKSYDFERWVILNIRLGSVELRLGEYESARSHIKSAMPHCDTLNLKLNKGLANVYLADIHLIKSEFGDAYQKADKALSIFKSIERLDWQTSALTDLAYICIRAKDYKSAREYFNLINKLKPKIEKESFLVRPNLFEGILNYQLGNNTVAKSQLLSGIEQINSIGTFPDLPLIFQYLAKISIQEKDLKSAKDFAQSAIKYAERADNINFLNNAHLINIEVNKLENPDYDYLNDATQIYDWAVANHDSELIKKSSLLISERHENFGKLQDALIFRGIYESALVSSINKDKFNEITLLKEKNKFQQEAKETSLREENLQIKVNTSEKIKGILLSSTSLLVLMLSCMIFMFFKIRKKTNLLALNNAELIKAESNLARKNGELEAYIESNSQLEQFAHVASHDLRSPILTINSFAELLRNKASNKLNDNEKQYLSFIEKKGKQMLDLVTDLLDYSKLNSQVLNIEDVEINKLLDEVTSTIKPQANEKNIKIETVGNYPTIKADVIKLKRVFQNLVSNSIKFSDKEKTPYVKIKCEEDNANYKFTIEDNGIGIKNNKVDLFAPYVQLNPKSEYNGTGLGLSVCKKIIEQHGGTINYQGKEGEGTVFSFSIAKDIEAFA